MAAIRRAEATWSGPLSTGSGTVSAVSSGAFSDLPVSWAARTEASDGKTSPEELVAAAHSACFAMALSGALGRAGHAAGAARRLGRGHLRQARGGLAGRLERADGPRRGARASPPRTSPPPPRQTRTAARSARR